MTSHLHHKLLDFNVCSFFFAEAFQLMLAHKLRGKKSSSRDPPRVSNGLCSMEDSVLIKNIAMAVIIIWRAERSLGIYEYCFAPHVKSLREIYAYMRIFIICYGRWHKGALCRLYCRKISNVPVE